MELAEGEQIKWATSPVPRRVLLRSLPNTAMFFVILAVPGLMWGSSQSSGTPVRNGHGPLLLFALTPILAALLHFAWQAWRAHRLTYVITDRRAFILEPAIVGRPFIQQIDSSQLGSAEEVSRGDGTGDLILLTIEVRGGKGRKSKRLVGFFGLSEVAEPSRLIAELSQKVEPRRPSVSRQQSSPSSFTVFALLVALGLTMAGVSAPTLLKAFASSHWPTTTGTILESYVFPVHPAPRGPFQPVVTFNYDVGEKTYTGETIAIGLRSTSENLAKVWVSRFSPGQHVRVSYSPSAPAEGVLHPGIFWSYNLVPVMGLLMCALAISGFATLASNDWPRNAVPCTQRLGSARPSS